MKKYIYTFLIIGICAIGSQNAHAQLKYGPIVGLNGSKLSSYDLGLGINVGVFVELEILDRFSWRPEVIYSSRGSKNEVDNGTGVDTYKYRISSVDLSILSFYVPFSNNLNAHIGTRSSNFGTGKVNVDISGVDEANISSPNSGGLFGGFYFGLMYETVSGLTFEGRFTVVPAGDGAADDLDGSYTEFMVNASYKLDW